jgi:multidrug resistance efflux pump
MKNLSCWTVFTLLGGLVAWSLSAVAAEDRLIEVSGKSQPAAGRSAVIATAVAQPVTEVLVSSGDRVKTAQPLVKLNDEAAQAEVRVKRAVLTEAQAALARLKAEPVQEAVEMARVCLDSARTATKNARTRVEQIEEVVKIGAIPTRLSEEAKAALAACWPASLRASWA